MSVQYVFSIAGVFAVAHTGPLPLPSQLQITSSGILQWNGFLCDLCGKA